MPSQEPQGQETESVFGMQVIETTSLPDDTAFIVDMERVAKCFRWSGPDIIQVEPFPRDALMKIVLGPKPDWVRDA